MAKHIKDVLIIYHGVIYGAMLYSSLGGLWAAFLLRPHLDGWLFMFCTSIATVITGLWGGLLSYPIPFSFSFALVCGCYYLCSDIYLFGLSSIPACVVFSLIGYSIGGSLQHPERIVSLSVKQTYWGKAGMGMDMMANFLGVYTFSMLKTIGKMADSQVREEENVLIWNLMDLIWGASVGAACGTVIGVLVDTGIGLNFCLFTVILCATGCMLGQKIHELRTRNQRSVPYPVGMRTTFIKTLIILAIIAFGWNGTQLDVRWRPLNETPTFPDN